MPNLRSELKSRYASLRRLHDDLRDSSLSRPGWDIQVRARRTLGSDEPIEHWFLAEHFLVGWSNWSGLFDRFRRYFGQPDDSFPRTWAKLIADCEVLVFRLTREDELDRIIAKYWVDPDLELDRPVNRRSHDIASIYTRIARDHERVELLIRAEHVHPRFAPRGKSKESLWKQSVPEAAAFTVARTVVFEQNGRLLEYWQKLPRRVQGQVWVHLRHYLHSTLGVSWLVESTPAVSALLSISWRKQAVSLSVQEPAAPLQLDPSISASVGRLFDRLKAAIAELGYDAILEDLSSPELIGGADSLLGSDDVMVVPGHLADQSRPILLAATKGWNGKEPKSFAKVMRQVKARLTESRGAIRVVVVFCDCWDSTSFQEEHRDELRAHEQNGVRFLFIMVGVPDRVLVPIPVELEGAAR
jgi:hypothetical protein